MTHGYWGFRGLQFERGFEVYSIDNRRSDPHRLSVELSFIGLYLRTGSETV